MKESEKIAIGGGVAAGLAAIVYYMTRPAAAAAAPAASVPAPTAGTTAGVGMLGATAFNPASSLRGGQQLLGGQSLYSPRKLYRAVMQTDGNLVVYTAAKIGFYLPGTVVWSASTNNSCAVRAIMQTDGNFVLYKTKISSNPEYAVYASNTQGHPGAWITMQDDGNLVVYSAAGEPLWASKSQPSSSWYYYSPSNNCSIYRNL
jgi:hypothetical protein